MILIMALLLSSCSPFIGNTQDYSQNEWTLADAWREVSSYRYQWEIGSDYWKSPKEFVADGGGDCEDFCVYMVYLLGKDAGMVRVGNHALVSYHGKYIEPQEYLEYVDLEETDILARMDYWNIMAYATSYGSKGML